MIEESSVGKIPTQSNDFPTSPSKSIDKEIDIDTDIDKELDIESKKTPPRKKPVRHKYGEYKNVLLSDEDMEKLKTEFPTDWQDRIERLSEYIASSGKTYKNYLATIRNWARKDAPKQTQGSRKPQSSGNVFLDLLEE